MCGIFCAISAKQHVKLNAEASALLARRGPDALKTHSVTVQASERTWHLTFTSSVLSLRGDQVQEQPLIDLKTGSVLCWNGEAWSFQDVPIMQNDTRAVFTELLNGSESVLDVFGVVKGPFAFVFYDASARILYFGRDVLGRRSLLLSNDCTQRHELTISSTNFAGRWTLAEEVATPYIFSIDLNQPLLTIDKHPLKAWSPQTNKSLPSPRDVQWLVPSDSSIAMIWEQLKKSLELRVKDIPTYTVSSNDLIPSRVAVLFSGGLDCTLLTRMLHEILPFDQPVDLLNVAFENPRVVNARARDRSDSNGLNSGYELCPDRITGRSSFQELCTVCPGRTWRFVAVDVPFEVFENHRSSVIQLMYPHDTEMDLSITAALYFAARGTGVMTTASESIARSYTTSARVLLSGLGADELFAGYARHAAAYARGSYEALADELDLDYKRIGSRNLGRDDRVISNWGRETRYPFLDEDFVSSTLSLPSWEKCGFRPQRHVSKHFENTEAPQNIEDLHPEKILLRCLLWQLGMRRAAAEKKRAIQFGARTAKMYGGKSKGTDVVT